MTEPTEPQAPKRKAKAKAKPKPQKAKARKPPKDDLDLFPPLRPEDVPKDDEAPIPTPQELKRARIYEIAQLMASGEWRPHLAKKLGESWGLTKKTAQHYSAEASRLLDYTTNQRATLVNIARLRLLQVLQQDEGDRVQAARTLLEHMGELRQNVTVKAPDPFDGWSEEEITAYADTGQRPQRFSGGRKK